MPNGHLELAYFSNALLRWFPNSRERGLWLKNWNTYPIEPYKFFEQVRRGLGENRNIIEAPFHVIAPTPYTDYEARTPHQADEEASVSGLMLLAMCFDWEFYLLARDCSDYVFVSDNTVLYSTSDPIKIENRNQHEQRGLP